MSSTKEYKDYVIDQLRALDNLSYKPMMGKFLLFYKNALM